MASLEDDQAIDVVTIDLSGKSAIADHMIVASGRSRVMSVRLSTSWSKNLSAKAGRFPG